MKLETRLPRNGKEGALYGGIICTLTVLLMTTLSIILISEKLDGKFTEPADSFNAKILFRILFTVLGMSACMTLIGDIVGNGISSEIFSRFLTNWPRNFLIVLIAESLVIQPIARFAMVKLHAYQDKKNYASMMTK
ncbi:DUF2798 domain-containing protein [Peribacillus sp. TH16]|uniref:DUF2798 domain-containing protein n=1 Tax=Peribacillus sp. TH16 TaxID=2798482 RepID=UPI00191269F9|nr:DUF2798 domain-containing protein [Peribacillus sp. TH16]MBK5485173.1 DUF2798 domain-containing protein [Peribacillus sp. TH16]